MFSIVASLSKSFTVTLNSTLLLSSGLNVISIPVSVNSVNVFPLLAPSILMLSGTNVVPVGMLSVTFAVAGAVPSFVTVIVYVISSPASTVSPLGGTDVFCAFTSALFTMFVVSFVFSPSTVALFTISALYSSPGNVFTVTWKLIVVFPTPLSVFACTLTCIPFAKSV